MNNYIWQRITAIILLFLTPWFLWKLFEVKDLSYFDVVQNFNTQVTAALLCLMIFSGFYHGYLGIRNICLDYIPSTKIRFFILLVICSLFGFLGLLTTFSLVALRT